MGRITAFLMIAVALAVGVWSVFKPRSTEVESDTRQSDQVLHTVEDQTIHSTQSAEADYDDGIPPIRTPEGGERSTNVANSGRRAWPGSPELMETVLLAELSQVPLVSVLSFDCTESTCELHFIPGRDFSEGLTLFVKRFSSPPYNALISTTFYSSAAGRVAKIDLAADFTSEQILDRKQRQRRYLAELRQSDPEGLQSSIADERDYLIHKADEALDTDAYDASPVTFDGYLHERMIVENVCSLDCPRDTQRIVHYDIPDDLTCDQMNGVEQRLSVLDRTTGLGQRVFCVPSVLIAD